MTGPNLSLRVSQQLALTPQLQQSIRLLQLSSLELSQEIEQMLSENPFLEVEEDAVAPREEFGLTHANTPASKDDYATDATASKEEASSADNSVDIEPSPSDWEGDGSVDMAPDDGEWGGDAPARGASGDSDLDPLDIAYSHETLTDHLHRQALALHLSEVDTAALRFLIESLNDDGYLDESLESLAHSLAGTQDAQQVEELLHRFTVARSLLQNLEPTGVGACDLAECLSLQLRAMQQEKKVAPEVLKAALTICGQPLEWLARRDVRRLSQAADSDEATTRAAMALIARLEPRPGRRFANVERNVIVPDVIVKKIGKGGSLRFSVQLNPDTMPRLRLHDVYANMVRGESKNTTAQNEAGQGLQQRVQEARWFIKNIQQRFDTILRVSRVIVERQKNFFTHGALAMRPMVLREIAEVLEMHESTISRVTSGKYMATPHGTFELKYFFGSSVGTDAGGDASSIAVRALIKQFIASEDTKKPLSDSRIAELLKEQGIECARRTVAKYRETLKIPVSTLRKTL